MRTGKIGLRKLFYERRVPGVEDRGGDLCGQGEQTVYHIYQCAENSEQREGVHGKKRRKNKHGAISPRSQCWHHRSTPAKQRFLWRIQACWDSSRPETEKKKIEPDTFVTKNQVQMRTDWGWTRLGRRKSPKCVNSTGHWELAQQSPSMYIRVIIAA